ncbi:MAG: hypothetical protein ACTSRS_17710 [Candidatus Helarchaeota archaeon]
MAINFLSKSTWQKDIGIHVEYCRLLKIPLYIVFSPFYVGKAIIKPPFLRAYFLEPEGDYHIQDLRTVSVKKGESAVNREAILDVSGIVPFKLGIMELESQHEGDLPRYRLILVNPETYEIYPTRAEQAEARVEQAEARAEQAEARAEQAEARAKRLQNQLEEFQRKT